MNILVNPENTCSDLSKTCEIAAPWKSMKFQIFVIRLFWIIMSSTYWISYLVQMEKLGNLCNGSKFKTHWNITFTVHFLTVLLD